MNKNTSKSIELPFFEEMFKHFHSETCRVRELYLAILYEKDLLLSLYNDPVLKEEKYHLDWVQLASYVFTRKNIEPKHREVLQWVLPIMIKNNIEDFKAVNTFQKNNSIYQALNRTIQAKVFSTEIFSSQELTNAMIGATKNEDLDFIIKILAKHPQALSDQKNILFRLSPIHNLYLNLDKSKKLARLAQLLDFSAAEFKFKWLGEKYSKKVDAANNALCLNHYWVDKIFNSGEIGAHDQEKIIEQFFYNKDVSNDFFYLRLTKLINSYKSDLRILDIFVPHIQKFLAVKSISCSDMDSNKSNHIFWLLNFIKNNASRIDEAVSSGTAKQLQLEMIKLERKILDASVSATSVTIAPAHKINKV